MTIRCDSCATRLLETQEFCPKCGKPNSDYRRRAKRVPLYRVIGITSLIVLVLPLAAVKLIPLRVLYKVPGSIYPMKVRQVVYGDRSLAADTLEEYLSCWKAKDFDAMSLFTEYSSSSKAEGDFVSALKRYPLLPESYKIYMLSLKGSKSDAVVKLKTADLKELTETLGAMADPGKGNSLEAVKAAISGATKSDLYLSVELMKRNGRWTLPAKWGISIEQILNAAIEGAEGTGHKYDRASLRVRQLRCTTYLNKIVRVTGLLENNGSGGSGPVSVTASFLNEAGDAAAVANRVTVGPEPNTTIPFECFAPVDNKVLIERYAVRTEVLLK